MNSSRKITMLCQLFYPEMVSTGQSLTELSVALQKFNRKIHVLCAPPTIMKQKTTKHMTYKGISIERVWATRFNKKNILGKTINHLSFSLSLFFKLLFSSDKTPLFMTTNPPFIGVIGYLISKFKERPLIYALYDIYPETAIHCQVISAKNPIAIIWKKINHLIYSQSQDIIVIGRCMQDYVKNTTPETQHHKIKHIHVYSDNTLIEKEVSKNLYIKKWQLENKFIVLYSGNIGRFHDMTTIMNAAIQLNKTDPNICFLFIGDGQKKATCQKIARTNSLSNCQFHDYVPKSDIGHTHQLADIGLVSLAENQTGFSVPSKTYGILAAKKPAIAIMKKECEIAQMINEDQSGRVIPNGDTKLLIKTILELQKDPELRHHMGENGYRSIKAHYSLEKSAEKHEALFKEID